MSVWGTFCLLDWIRLILNLSLLLLRSIKSRHSKFDALDQWSFRMILRLHWYQHVSDREVWRITEQPLLTLIIEKRHLILFGHESADARRILTTVPQSDWQRLAGRPHT